ncbi:MAG: signal peptidase II [Patescibacteria group bacterium]
MKLPKLSSILPPYSFYFFILFVVLITQLVRIAVNNFEIYSIKNNHPFSLPIEGNYLIVGFFVAYLLSLSVGLQKKYPLAVGIIFGGVFSNLIEKVLFGHANDYIRITWGYINLADLVLWFGLILLNYEVWFNDIEIETPPVHLNSFADENVINTNNPLVEEQQKQLLHNEKSKEERINDLMPKVNRIRTVADQIKKNQNIEFSLPKIEEEIKPVIKKPQIKVS